MKKKSKKPKKKRRSIAWKHLEKYVAKRLNGTRINRALDYSQSLPDVVVNSQPIFGKQNIKIVVECKHSQTQPFVDLLSDSLKAGAVTIGDYIFWDLEKIEQLRALPITNITNKQLPTYILDNYKQAEGYDIHTLSRVGLIYSNDWILPIVVIAKKNSRTRIAYTKMAKLQELDEKLL